MKHLFRFPEKSKWIDVGTFDRDGSYFLIQMRYRLDNNRKQFRVVRIGFINDPTIKLNLFNNIISNSC